MIISHRHRFIFLKTTKVAGTSIEIALSRICGPRDVITAMGSTADDRRDEQTRKRLGYRGPQNHLKPLRRHVGRDWAQLVGRGVRAEMFSNHTTAAQVAAAVPQEVWSSYTKISVVRNPYDLAISRYHWDVAQQRTNLGFEDYFFTHPEGLTRNRTITHIDGVSSVDIMLKFETLHADLTRLSQTLDLPADMGAVVATLSTKSGSRPRNADPGAYFRDAPRAAALIGLLCRDDIETYGYTPPVARRPPDLPLSQAAQ